MQCHFHRPTHAYVNQLCQTMINTNVIWILDIQVQQRVYMLIDVNELGTQSWVRVYIIYD